MKTNASLSALIAMLSFAPSLLAATVSGHIVDSATGEPVERVRLYAYLLNPDTPAPAPATDLLQTSGVVIFPFPAPSATQITDANGAFTLEGLAAGSYLIDIVPSDPTVYQYRRIDKVDVATDLDTMVGTIAVEHHPFVITSVKMQRKSAVATVHNYTDKAADLVFWANVEPGGSPCVPAPPYGYLFCYPANHTQYTVTSQPAAVTIQPGSNNVTLRIRLPDNSPVTYSPIVVNGGYSITEPAMYPRQSGYKLFPGMP